MRVEPEEAALRQERDDEIAKADATFTPRMEEVKALRIKLLEELDVRYEAYQKDLAEKREALLSDIETRHAARCGRSLTPRCNGALRDDDSR